MGLNQAIDIAAEQCKTILALLERHLPNTTAWGLRLPCQVDLTAPIRPDLVVFATPEQNRRVSDLREAFEESSLPFRVDLFVWDEVPEQSEGRLKRIMWCWWRGRNGLWKVDGEPWLWAS